MEMSLRTAPATIEASPSTTAAGTTDTEGSPACHISTSVDVTPPERQMSTTACGDDRHAATYGKCWGTWHSICVPLRSKGSGVSPQFGASRQAISGGEA